MNLIVSNKYVGFCGQNSIVDDWTAELAIIASTVVNHFTTVLSFTTSFPWLLHWIFFWLLMHILGFSRYAILSDLSVYFHSLSLF